MKRCSFYRGIYLSFFIKITPHTAVAAITIIAITPSFCPPAQ